MNRPNIVTFALFACLVAFGTCVVFYGLVFVTHFDSPNANTPYGVMLKLIFAIIAHLVVWRMLKTHLGIKTHYMIRSA